jgi:NAD(P)-dependent dehydrogenase (short-subunit alcohol dehydrogenase family)
MTAVADERFSIRGRRTVITGGTAGIGHGVAAHFVAEGAEVVITGRRASGAEIAEGIGAHFVAMDVADDDSVRDGMAAAAERLDGLDVVILNAGISLPERPVAELDLDAFRRVIDVNLFGVIRGIRFGLEHLGSGGVIIVTSSPGGRQGLGAPGMLAYGASKAAVDQLVRGAALQLAHQGIRVCGVLPGLILTEIAGEREGPIWLSQLTASGQARVPDDMAPAFHLLASEAGAMFQGSIVAADDGCSAGLSASVVARLIGR